MQKNRRKAGFTLAETLIAVAIILILSGVVFINVLNYMRSLAQLERDGIAKEIFIAAQNHLTMAEHEGYLGKTDFGTEEKENNKGTGICYFVVNSAADFTDDSVLKMMLPFASVDETVRLGGSYIVRYQKDLARVMDVFFSWPNRRFPHEFEGSELPGLLDSYTGESNKARRNYGGAVIGWYGGDEALNLSTITLDTPTIEIKNAEKLTVMITDPNDSNSSASLQLILKGLASDQQVAIPLSEDPTSAFAKIIQYDNTAHVYTVTLDDITTARMHFTELFSSYGLIPGENISIQAIAYSNTALSNIAYSAEKTTNSLFGDISANTGAAVASISNIRHLENLDDHISAVSYNGTELAITSAVQTTDLDWTEFKTAIGDSNGTKTVVYNKNSMAYSSAGNFMPVSPDYALSYDGTGHNISKITVSCASDAGLFGILADGTVSNLMLNDFTVSTTSGNAGALAGTLSGAAAITNVVVRDTNSTATGGSDTTTAEITASANAGGLIGSLDKGIVEGCAAAVTVSGGTAAGGLIGTVTNATGTAEITACYSGGHTSDGTYLPALKTPGAFDVTSGTGTSGGLIGAAGDAVVSNSYSTCSVSGGTAGGLVGTGSGSISSCYATGLVSGTTAGAFAGSFSGSTSYNLYFEIINEIRDGDGKFTGEYLAPLGSAGDGEGISALDEDIDSYNTFVRSPDESPDEWAFADPYDSALSDYYQDRYNLKTVAQLGGSVENDWFVNVHYGDWPAPEIFVINVKS